MTEVTRVQSATTPTAKHWRQTNNFKTAKGSVTAKKKSKREAHVFNLTTVKWCSANLLSITALTLIQDTSRSTKQFIMSG